MELSTLCCFKLWPLSLDFISCKTYLSDYCSCLETIMSYTGIKYCWVRVRQYADLMPRAVVNLVNSWINIYLVFFICKRKFHRAILFFLLNCFYLNAIVGLFSKFQWLFSVCFFLFEVLLNLKEKLTWYTGKNMMSKCWLLKRSYYYYYIISWS